MYHYFVNPTSTTASMNAPHQMDRMTIELMLIDAFRERGALEPWHDEIEGGFFREILSEHMVYGI